MSEPQSGTVYLMVSGAVTASRAPEFVAQLSVTYDRVIIVQTPNAKRIISPLDLRTILNAHLVESYFDSLIVPRPVPGPVLFAPCSFSSLNKLAHGIADNLAISITEEMIGFRQRVVVAVSVNAPLYAHQIVQESTDRLRTWGVVVIDPEDTGAGLMMAPTDTIMRKFYGG